MKAAFLDIETTDLKANFGRVLCAVFLPWNTPGKARIFRLDEYRVPKGLITNDTRLLQAIADEMQQWHILATYYGASFDIPFVRARMLAAGVEPPESIQHVDFYWQFARPRMLLTSRRMGSVGDFLCGNSEKTHLQPRIWLDAQVLDKKAMDYIVKHCVHDCRELAQIAKRIPRRWMPRAKVI